MRARAGAVVVVAALLAAGCGGDDRLSEEEATQRINDSVAETTQEFEQQVGSIFQQIGRLPEDAEVPDRIRTRLDEPTAALAARLRETADELADLDPPEDAEDEVEALEEASREQAERIEELPAREGLTVRELADAMEPPSEELRRLREAGLDVRLPDDGG